MTGKKHKSSKWTIPLVTAIVGALVSFALDFFKDKPIFSTIWGWIVWLWNIVITFLNLNIKVWWLIIALVAIYLLLYLIANINKAKGNFKPDFTQYTEDTLKKYKWNWSWKYDSFRKVWLIDEPFVVCPNCETAMTNQKLWHVCPRCNRMLSHQEYEDIGTIEQIILDNIRRKNYPGANKENK